MDAKRLQEVLEACLSYAYSNIDDINTAFEADQDNPDVKDALLVRARYIAPLTEDEVGSILADLDEWDGCTLQREDE